MLSKIANIHKLCFPNKAWSETDFSDLKKSGCEIVASDNGFIVWRTVGDETEIITIGVAPSARGGGIAMALLGLMEIELNKNNVKKIFLEVSAENAPARALYEKMEYKQIGVRKKYYDGVDAVIMQKILF